MTGSNDRMRYTNILRIVNCRSGPYSRILFSKDRQHGSHPSSVRLSALSEPPCGVYFHLHATSHIKHLISRVP